MPAPQARSGEACSLSLPFWKVAFLPTRIFEIFSRNRLYKILLELFAKARHFADCQAVLSRKMNGATISVNVFQSGTDCIFLPLIRKFLQQ